MSEWLTFQQLKAALDGLVVARPEDWPCLRHSDERHGHWVRERGTGQVGRIAYEIIDGPAIVLWGEATGFSPEGAVGWGLCRSQDLTFESDRPPVPWNHSHTCAHASVARLLAAAGLTPAGAVRWGSPVPLDRPGVYLVSLAPEPEDTRWASPFAPFSGTAIGELLRICDQLRLDGRRPTASQLVDRIGAFWLSSETVLYVGKAAISVHQRVLQYYATPLGARSPHAGGWFLKTLSILDRLSVHYAATADPDGAERLLVQRFMDSVPDWARDSLPDPTLPLPFANLQVPGGRRKPHGITGATGCRNAGQTAGPSSRRMRVTGNRPGRVTLHEEILDILNASGDRWMTTAEIAEAVRRRGIYKKRDGTSDVTAFQVHGRTKNYPHLFELDGSRVRRRR